jgi:hypothetical protein
MKKILIIALMVITAVTAFGDQIVRDGKGRRIKLMSNYTYTIVYDGEIVRDSNGRKILLKDNKTWEYFSDVYLSDILEDESGKKVWLKSNGTWGYMRRNEEREFKFRNVSIEDAGRKTRISGRVKNDSMKDYDSATFKLIIFDKNSYEYRSAGTITIEDFYRGDSEDFEVTMYIRSNDIASYYFEFVDGIEKRERRERVIKKKRPKAIFEFKMDIKN